MSLLPNSNAGFFRNAGSFEIPENMIILSRDTLSEGFICDGNNSTPNLANKFLRCNSSSGGTGGNTTHSHSYTGSTSSNSSTGTKTDLDQSGFNIWRGPLNASHNHTINHSHSGSNLPSYINLLSYLKYSGLLTDKMVFFFDGGVIPFGWSSQTDIYDKFIRSVTSSPETTGGSSTHTHSASVSTGSKSLSSIYCTTQSHYYFAGSTHNHSYSHTHGSTDNQPANRSLIPISPDGNLAEFPSGVCAFFEGTSVDIPDGWSYFSEAENKFIKPSSSSGTDGGSDTHSHSISGNTANASNNVRGKSSGGYTLLRSEHTHTYNHTHGATDHKPPYYESMLCKKD